MFSGWDFLALTCFEGLMGFEFVGVWYNIPAFGVQGCFVGFVA